MNDQPGRPDRRPLSQPFSHPEAAVDQPHGERLLPVERSPFSTPAPDTAGPAAGPTHATAPGGRRPLGGGGLADQPPA